MIHTLTLTLTYTHLQVAQHHEGLVQEAIPHRNDHLLRTRAENKGVGEGVGDTDAAAAAAGGGGGAQQGAVERCAVSLPLPPFTLTRWADSIRTSLRRRLLLHAAAPLLRTPASVTSPAPEVLQVVQVAQVIVVESPVHFSSRRVPVSVSVSVSVSISQR